MIIKSINDLKKRTLEKTYVIWYFVKYPMQLVKDRVTEIKDLIVIYGVTVLGKRQIIGTFIEDTENNRYWYNEVAKIKSRHVESVLFCFFYTFLCNLLAKV